MKFLLVEEDKIKDNCLTKSHNLSPEQAEFFKDSKIRNADGELLVCSHNSFSKFDSFDKSKIGDGLNFGKGFYFFDNVPNKVPKEFGENQYLCYMNITNPAILDDPKEFAIVLNKLGFSGYEDMLSDPWYEIADVFDNFDVDYEDIADTVATVGYDGIWVPKYGEVIAFEPNQIKLITNTNPTNSDNINEDIWNKAGTIYQPKQDSRYKRLIRKPINTLTQEEIKYIFTIHWCWYLANVRRFDYIEDALENTDDRFSEEYFKECYDFLHSLSFPLKVYRAIRDSEHSNDEFTINGKNSSYSWSTNINIYKDATSKFRNCTKIVSCEIDSNVIDVANTINNFIFYTSSHHDRGYGEYEITLKQHFPQSALKNLHWIDKNEINEKLLSESLHSLGSNCFITDSPYDIKNLIMNKPKLYRILYDANIDMYMIGDGYDIVHWDMIQEAERQGYYVNQEEFIDELGGTLDNYVETGINGLYEDDYEINPYLLYMVSSPSAKEWDEEVMEYGDDGYNSQLKFNFGYLFLRDADENLMDNCDLIRILQKQSWANESMNLNESFQDEMAVRTLGYECKEDNLPLMDYKEFIELLVEQGMTPSKELYQVYVDAYNYNSVDIEEITTKFEQMSSDDIINLLGIPHSDAIDTNSPMFILPNGSIISVTQAGKLIGQRLEDNIHSDMVYVILSAIAKSLGQEWNIDDKRYEEKQLDFLTYGLNWARVNTGTTWLEDRFYCVLPNHMTSAQYRSLEKWLEWGTDNNKDEVLVYVGRDEVNQTYYFNETFPEDIIKKIKRYYSSGRLYESLDKNNLLDIIYNQLPVQKEVYNGNTLILPDGRFINTHKLNKDSLFHEGIYDYICDIFDEDIPYGDIEDTLLTQYGCVKVDNVYPYVAVSHNRPTAAQYRSLTDWIDSIVNTSDYENRYIVDMGLPIEVRFLTTDKYYDLQYEDSNSIVRKIKKAFTSGILESNRNEMKENMDITNEVQRAVDNVIKNKSKYRNQDDLESAIYSAVANCFSGMHGVTRTTSDMIDDVYEKELERVGLNTMNETVDISNFNFTNYRNPDGQSHPKCKTYRSTLEYMASETERLFNKCLKNYWGETKPYDQLTIEYMNLNRHSCTRDLVGAGAEQGLKDAQSAIFKRQGELLELSKQFTKWDGKEWVKVPNQHNKPLGEGIYSYQTYIRTGERGKPIYTLSYGQSTIIARYDKNSYMITFGTDWEHHISHLIEWLKEYYPNFFVKQVDGSFGGFIPTEEEAVQYIKNEIRRGKALTESNELADRAKRHKKKSKGMGWHMAVNAGDVEKGIEVFNNSTSLGSDTSGGEGTAMGEALDQNTYYYDGPIYYDGRKIAEKSDIYTTAKSLNIAIRNTLFKAAKGDKELYHYDIVDHLVREIPKTETPKVRPLCKVCGYEINDMGDCPVCDYGEDDLLESLSSLEALWQLNSIDE